MQPQKEMIYYPVPRPIGLPGGETPQPTPDFPAVLSYIIRVRGTDEQGVPRDLLYFYIGRDRSVSLSSFTITYRFSALPVMMEDPAHPFYAYEYTDTDINDDNEYIVCKFSLPASLSESFPGCAAYIRRIVHTDGTVSDYTPEVFTYTDRDMAQLSRAMESISRDEAAKTRVFAPSSGTQDDEEETFDALLSAQRGQQERRHRKFRFVRIAGYVILAVGLLSLGAIGVQYLSFQKTMLGAQVYIDAGEHAQAEAYADAENGDNLFYISRRTALSRTLDRLRAEGRYNEAYKIASLSPYASLMQQVCREAADKALEEGDYQTAYIYAFSAPDPFDEEITQAAAAVILDPYSASMDERAYLVAQKTTDPEARNDLLLNIVRYACGENHYHVAMRAALAIDDAAVSAETVADVFGIATRHYITHDAYHAAADFITRYSGDGNTVDADVEGALISYFSESRDADSAFFLAKQFGIDASDIPITPDDPAVRADLAGTYPLLTDAQKRQYHARRITADGVLFVIDNAGKAVLGAAPTGVTPAGGRDTSMASAQKRVDDLLGKKPVISVASGALVTVFLHDDGTLTVLSNRIIGGTTTTASAEEIRLATAAESLSGIVAVAAGEAHFVLLHADGTVSAIGDNAYGQCDTTGSAWQNIVAIAAGDHFTLGLRTDGTVIAVGAAGAGACDTADFNNVVDIAACDRTAVVLFSDGTVGIRGERSMGIADVTKLENVTRIRAGGCAVIAETADGIYTICGTATQTGNYGSTASWHNVVDYAVGSVCASVLEEDGKIRTTGTNRAKQQ